MAMNPRLTEGRRLQQIVRRGKHGSVRVRRAMIIMASASGTLVPAIGRLVAADEDTVRDGIQLFNEKGLAALDPRWAGGRPRLISDGDVDVIVAAARTRPEKLGQPFTHWSLRKLCVGDDQLWGVTRLRKGADHTLAALKSIRAARPGGYRLFVILDNLSANKTAAILRWAQRENVELCFTPVNASWANPIEAQFGPVRTFVLGGSDHPSHTVLARKLQDYLRWRNANARHPDVLAAQRRERACSERQQRWGRPKPKAA
jgi:transposase